jgi:ABC-type uncharacterized transport system substrate-binding protein
VFDLVQVNVKASIAIVLKQSADGGVGWPDAYAASNAEVFSEAARYVDNILKGCKPADLPVNFARLWNEVGYIPFCL